MTCVAGARSFVVAFACHFGREFELADRAREEGGRGLHGCQWVGFIPDGMLGEVEVERERCP